ncbi:MAG: pirin family protein [Pseudomonadota bacterium]|nr:pirin family protein [Pseudomonadota bacterium]
MSNLMTEAEQACSETTAPCPAIKAILSPRVADLGGFSVRRLLPTAKQKMVGPWIFFDEMGRADFPAGEGINVRPHPHIGLATVTYLFEGEILHRDSLGSFQAIRPGDINLMVAGRGITHSERERPEVTARDHSLHGLQLWLALPPEQEETDPAFYHYPGTAIPSVDAEGVPVRVMIGSAYGVTSPVVQHSATLYLEAFLKAGQSIALPEARERGLYVVSGKLKAQGSEIAAHSMAILAEQAGVSVTAVEDTRIALIGGDPLGKRFIEWNFVSSSKERIEAAKADWRAGRFARVVGDESDYIPY